MRQRSDHQSRATALAGAHKGGSLFELVPASPAYVLTILLSFDIFRAKGPGVGPSSGPILTKYGALIGTTSTNTVAGQSPSLYEYKNTMRVLQTFTGGDNPNQPTLDRNGTIYGITQAGGIIPCIVNGQSIQGGCGVIYNFVR